MLPEELQDEVLGKLYGTKARDVNTKLIRKQEQTPENTSAGSAVDDAQEEMAFTAGYSKTLLPRIVSQQLLHSVRSHLGIRCRST